MKKIFVFVPIFLAFVLLFTAITPLVAMSEDISEKVFRLHILANSDEIADQELKLKVRDRVLSFTAELYKQCDNVDEAINCSNENIEEIENEAQKVVAYYGYDYDVDAYVIKEYFNTRVYDGFTLPAGMYDSLKIEIGEAKGHNWWCVMFPTVCVTGCVDDLGESLNDDELKFVKSNKYIVKFKTVEIIERIKSKIYP